MNPFTKLLLAAGVTGIGLLAVAGVFVGTRGSVRGYLDGNFTRSPQDSAGRSAVYTSPEPPLRVAERIAGAWKPAERINAPGGHFLRYRNEIVAVTAGAAGGSRIFVDDEDRGYARWYPYVGGRWGTFSGPGETFRGGGPAAGK
ncbi:MAG: DUF4247 domain-containing protein [Acidimicrobiia bacterium]